MASPDNTKLSAAAFAKLPGIRHGFFTRQGGVSRGIYASLNCGPGSRDDADAVRDNRARVAEALAVAPTHLLTAYQRHSAKAIIATLPWDAENVPEADAIVTNVPGLAAAVLSADCAPILFADAEARVVGAAHAGWRGALSGIAEAAVEAMLSLGARRERIAAVIGPSISQKAYEVGADYRDSFLLEDPNAAEFFAIDDSSGEPHFDLPAYVAERLQRAGAGAIDDLSLCTYCDETRLFSYRRSQHHGESDYGRQISAIVLA